MLAARLSLAQWLSPAFPTGAFAASHGLEWFIATGAVQDGERFQQWLEDILLHGAGWQDAVLLSLTLRDPGEASALAEIARALQPGAERLAETLDQGSAFARTVSAMGTPIAGAPLPIALGCAAAPLNLPPAEVIALYLHSFASNLTSVATRAVPLGQSEAQRRLANLAPLIQTLATRAEGAELADLGGAALGGDIASLKHETLDVRLYRT